MQAETHKVAYRSTKTGIDHKDQKNVLPSKWKKPSEMPAWAIRLRPTITASMCRRVDSIKEGEALATGLARGDYSCPGTPLGDKRGAPPSEQFREFWGKRHPKFDFATSFAWFVTLETKR